MRVSFFEFEGTTDEFNALPAVKALMDRLSERAVQVPDLDTDVDTDVVDEFDEDDPADAEDVAPPATGPDAIPGVPEEGQADTRKQLSYNPAADLFVEFLAVTTAWESATLRGVKVRRQSWDLPLDYSRYLRIRKSGSTLGAFVYVHAATGLIEPRLHFNTDKELEAIAPQARRHSKGHREYRVVIKIVDRDTLDQAIKLAHLAYDLI